MQTEPVEIYSELSNYAIVRMPGRSFPGCVIQGDSLKILLRHAQRVSELVKNSDDEDLIGETADLVEELQSHLEHYEQVLAEHGIRLPYTK
jgi:predicted RNase H-like HicB family nuclease